MEFTPDLLIQVIVQGGGMAVLAGFLYLFITRILPKFLDALESSRKDFTEALKEQMDSHGKAMLQVSMDIQENTKTLAELTNIISRCPRNTN